MNSQTITKRTLFTFLLSFFLVGINLSARIGETYKECIERYGKPKVDEKDSKTGEPTKTDFVKDGVKIEVLYNENEVVLIIYTGKLTPLQTSRLLEVNLEGNVPFHTFRKQSGKLYISQHVTAGKTIDSLFAIVTPMEEAKDNLTKIIIMTQPVARELIKSEQGLEGF